MAIAISSGVCAPIGKPIGHLVESIIAMGIFASNAASLNADHLVLEPIQPTLGL